MVTETVPEVEIADPNPEESQTQEQIPEVELPAAEPSEEAAAPAEEEKPLTRQEFDRLMAEREAEIKRQAVADARERERRDRQRENARRDQEQRRQAEEKAEAAEIVQAQLVRLGLTDANPDEIAPMLDRYANKRQQQWLNRYDSDFAEGARAAAADAIGVDFDEDLSEGSERFRRAILPYATHLLNQGRELALKNGDVIAKADIPKLVEAEIARRNQKADEGKTQVRRVDGNPSIPEADGDWIDRINRGQATEADRKRWEETYGRR